MKCKTELIDISSFYSKHSIKKIYQKAAQTLNSNSSGGDCSEYSQCENRGLLYECNSDCRVTDCKNRKFTKKQYPPLIKFKTSWGGFGLKGTCDLTYFHFFFETF